MHLYFAMRGEKQFTEQFITELQGKYFPFKIDGKDCHIKLGVRPVQLWEIAFPKEQKDVVLTTILGSVPVRPQYSSFEKWFKIIRKIIGLKPIGKYDSSRFMPVDRQHLDTIGIGLKDDKEHDFGEGI